MSANDLKYFQCGQGCDKECQSEYPRRNNDPFARPESSYNHKYSKDPQANSGLKNARNSNDHVLS